MRFDYSHLRFFSSNGTELPLVYDAPTITINNPTYKDEKGEYLIIRTEPGEISSMDDFIENVNLKRISLGKRFNGKEKPKSSLTINGKEYTDINVYPSALSYTDYTTSLGNEKYIDIDYPSLDKTTKQAFWTRYINKGLNIKELDFPTYKFRTKLSFDKVSTNLVETASIFVLVDNPEAKTLSDSSKFTTVYDLAQMEGYENVKEFMDRYQLMFFIDCREQSNFRFFTTNGDEVVWSDRYFIEFNNDNTVAVGDGNSGFRVDIGFTGEMEGVYEDTLHIVLIDKSTKNTDNDYPGDAYFIGQVTLNIETEGEDERYRTFFTNFGLPDPKYSNDVFSDTDINEAYPDYISINKHSKQLYLSYSEIFPYAGSYKALLNSIKMLGYDDIFFKEWYKEIGSTTNKGYVAYDMSYKHDKNSNTIANIPLEERIQLKKLNWISMMYRLNEELSVPIDRFGFPTVIEKSNYYNSGTLVKLMSLKKYLETYVLGANCRIMDVGGEGVVFERYNTAKYGTYQQVLEFTNEKGVSIEIDNPVAVISADSSSEVNVKVNTSSSYVKIADLESFKFSDYCEGYFDTDSTFHTTTDDVPYDTNNIYFGKTIELNDISNTLEIRCAGELDSFRLDKKYLTEESPDLIIDNGKIFFDPTQAKSMGRNSAFTYKNLPILQINQCIIKRYDNEVTGTIAEYFTVTRDINVDDSVSFIVTDKNGNRSELKDILTLLPPVFTESFNKPEVGETYTYETLDGTVCERTYGVYDHHIGENMEGFIGFVDVHNQNYGLRYTTDNIHNIPCFKIIGYTSNENYDLLQKDKEYFIEILDGKMIFADDDETLSITLKLNDDSNSIDVSARTLTTQQLPVTYKYANGSDSVTVFTNNTRYEQFCNDYTSFDYETAIEYNPIHPISLSRSGEYTVSALLYDEYNNVFCSSNNKTVNVITAKPKNINIYTTSDNGTHTVNDVDLAQCVYTYTPKRNIISSKIRASHENYDGNVDQNVFYHIEGKFSEERSNGILTTDVPVEARYAQISNTTDRFVLGGKINIDDRCAYIAYKTSSNDGHTYINDISTLQTVMSLYGIQYDHQHPENNAKSILDISKDEKYANNIGTLADVNISIYDNISEQLIEQLPGMLIPAKLTPTINAYYIIPTSDEDIDILENVTSLGCYDIYVTPSWAINTTHKYNNGSELRCSMDNTSISFPFINKLKYNSLLGLSYCGTREPKHYGHSVMLMGTKNNYNNDPTQILNSETLYPKRAIATHSCDDSSLYITPIDMNNVTYTVNLSNEHTMFTDTLYLAPSRHNANITQHIDAGFTSSIRNFDITKCQNCIMDVSDITGMSFEEHIIKDSDKFPQIVSESPVLLHIPSDSVSDDNNVTVNWKVHKQTSRTDKVDLYFEIYAIASKHVALNIKDKGIYDIEIICYDKHGNKHNKYISSAIIIK